jgi:transposase
MPKPLEIKLQAKERQELEKMRDKDSKAYLRERAAAILKIADGMSALKVAQAGLLKRRKVDTVCDWVHRYQSGGLEGLIIHSGRGRKAAFFPSAAG